MVSFSSTNIVGSSDSSNWSQAQVVTRDGGGQTLIVVRLGCEATDSLIDLPSMGSAILAEIEKKGQEIIKTIGNQVTEGVRIDVLLGIVNGSELKIFSQGEMETYLARNGQLAKLENNAVGQVLAGDVVVLCTKSFMEAVGLPKFRNIVTEQDNPAELLAPLMHMKAETGGMAAIVSEVEVERKQIEWPKIRLPNYEGPRKINLWVGGIILFLLVIMIAIGAVRKAKLGAVNEFNALNSSVEAKISETVTIGDLNPERARTLLTQARSEVESYLGGEIADEYKTKARALLVSLESAEERAFKKSEIQLNTVVELPILSDGLVASSMKTDGKGNLVFVDEKNKRLVMMNLSDRSRQVLDLSKTEEMVDVSIGETKVHELSGTGIYEMTWKKPEPKKVIEADEFWKNPKIVESFAGNVYVFDIEQSEIWKYPVLSDGFGSRRRWLAAGITPDLSKVVEMRVVGDIWLLTSSGKVERYSKGAPVPFLMEGFPTENEGKKLSDPIAMWVSESLVYVLERGAERVSVFGVGGKYQSQYVNSEFSKASDLVIVDDKAYVLIDNVVKEFGL